MKINPIAPTTPANPSSPAAPIQTRLGNQLTAAQQASRDKAIAALMGGTGNAQQNPVQNPTSISPEEAVIVKAPEESSQVDSIADPVVEALPADQSAEAATEEPAEAATQPKVEEPLSSQFAVLARKEKALRTKEQSFKQREAQLSAREAELSKQSPASIDTSKYISIEDLKRNPYGKLQEHGISYDDLTTQAVQAQSPEFQAIRQMREELQAELQKVREEQANSQKSIEEQQTQSYQQALRQIKNEASQLVNNDASFETIRETGSVTDVVDLIERTFKEEGTLLTVQEAAQIVEEYLVEEAMKLANLKKVQARLKPATPAAKPVEQQPKPNQQQPAKSVTLTNSMGSTRQLSARERAILAAKGELK